MHMMEMAIHKRCVREGVISYAFNSRCAKVVQRDIARVLCSSWIGLLYFRRRQPCNASHRSTLPVGVLEYCIISYSPIVVQTLSLMLREQMVFSVYQQIDMTNLSSQLRKQIWRWLTSWTGTVKGSAL